jgi:tetratricopeptide (TPR) repeat protein/lysophospholipase L1-like esterase
MIVFDSDEIQAVFEPGNSDFLLITFGAIAMRPNGIGFFGRPVTESAGISALGFMSKRPNWYPAADMQRAQAALNEMLKPYKERVTFGYSMGAYGAIKFSGLFDARTCVAISPQYSIDPKDVASFDRSYLHFFSEELHREMAVKKNECPADVFILYDNKYEVDIEHMKLYKKAIDPFLINVPYTGHETMRCFTGTKVATTLFEICRQRNLNALDALVRDRRKLHPIRAYQVCLAAISRHPGWADRILQNRAADMMDSEIYELAVRLGQEAAHRQMNDLAETAFVRALPLSNSNDNRAFSGLARVHFQQGEIPKAVELARRGIAANPDDLPTRAWLSGILWRNGDFREARIEAERGLVLSSGDLLFLRCMTDIAEQEGLLDEAVNWARRAITCAPDQIYLHERLLHLLMRSENWETAWTEALKLIDGNPTHPGLLHRMANICERRGKIDEALDWISRAASYDTGNIHLQERIAHFHMRMENFSAAEQVLENVIKINSAHFGTLRTLSGVCARQGEFGKAMIWAQQASAVAPDNIAIREWMTNLAVRLGDFVGAHRIAADAIDIDPQNVQLMRCLADACERLSKFADAVDWARKALAIDESNLFQRERFAHILMRVEDWPAAENVLLGSIAIDGGHIASINALSDAYARQQKFDEAVTWAHRACVAAPGDITLKERLVNLLMRSGDFQSARDEAIEAISLAPKNIRLMRCLTDVHERLSEFAEAVAWARMAVTADGSDLFLRDRLAQMLIQVNDLPAAEQILLGSLAIKPTHFGALRYLADVMLRGRFYDRAIAYAEQATNVEPTIAWFRDWFAGILLLVGDAEAADIQVRAGLLHAPGNEPLQRRLAQVKTCLALPRPWVAAAHDGNYGVNWKRRHAELAEGIKIANPSVLFIGDSITDQWAGAGRIEWNQYFAPLGAWQIGISGETTQGVLWRIGNGAIDGVSPQTIIVLIGTNNIGRNPSDDIVIGIERIWCEITARLPDARVAAIALTPRDPNPDSWHRLQVERINKDLKRCAERRGIAFVEVADYLLQPDGTLSPEIAPDGLHLSAAGYRQLATCLIERLPALQHGRSHLPTN